MLVVTDRPTSISESAPPVAAIANATPCPTISSCKRRHYSADLLCIASRPVSGYARQPCLPPRTQSPPLPAPCPARPRASNPRTTKNPAPSAGKLQRHATSADRGESSSSSLVRDPKLMVASRKSRCDGARPCGPCAKKGRNASRCTYQQDLAASISQRLARLFLPLWRMLLHPLEGQAH